MSSNGHRHAGVSYLATVVWFTWQREWTVRNGQGACMHIQNVLHYFNFTESSAALLRSAMRTVGLVGMSYEVATAQKGAETTQPRCLLSLFFFVLLLLDYLMLLNLSVASISDIQEQHFGT